MVELSTARQGVSGLWPATSYSYRVLHFVFERAAYTVHNSDCVLGTRLPLPAGPAPSPHADGAPLRPALLWMDMRSAREAADVAATGDPAIRVGAVVLRCTAGTIS